MTDNDGAAPDERPQAPGAVDRVLNRLAIMVGRWQAVEKADRPPFMQAVNGMARLDPKVTAVQAQQIEWPKGMEMCGVAWKLVPYLANAYIAARQREKVLATEVARLMPREIMSASNIDEVALPPPYAEPIHVKITCPECGEPHIDQPNPAIGWANPPHRTHRCNNCHFHFRVADVETYGAATLTTMGKLDGECVDDKGMESPPVDRKLAIHLALTDAHSILQQMLDFDPVKYKVQSQLRRIELAVKLNSYAPTTTVTRPD